MTDFTFKAFSKSSLMKLAPGTLWKNKKSKWKQNQCNMPCPSFSVLTFEYKHNWNSNLRCRCITITIIRSYPAFAYQVYPCFSTRDEDNSLLNNPSCSCSYLLLVLIHNEWGEWHRPLAPYEPREQKAALIEGPKVKGQKRRWWRKEVANLQRTGWEHVSMVLVDVQPLCRRGLISRFRSIYPTSRQKCGEKLQLFFPLSSLSHFFGSIISQCLCQTNDLAWWVFSARRARSGHGRVKQDVFPNYLTVYISFPCKPLW